MNKILEMIREELESRKDRSAWDKGVTVYALDMLYELDEAIDGGWFAEADLEAPKQIWKLRS